MVDGDPEDRAGTVLVAVPARSGPCPLRAGTVVVGHGQVKTTIILLGNTIRGFFNLNFYYVFKPLLI
jgi:hypothetical protein